MAHIVRVDHIAFAVKDLEQAIVRAEEKYGAKLLAKHNNEEQKYTVALLRLGENFIGLLTPMEEGGFVKDFLDKRGEGVHHIGLEVDDLEVYVKELESRGVNVPVKQLKGDGRKEALVSPRDGFGTVFQLIEWKSGANTSPSERLARVVKYHTMP